MCLSVPVRIDTLALHFTMSSGCRMCLPALRSLSQAFAQASILLSQAYPSEGQKHPEDLSVHKAPLLDPDGPSKQAGLHSRSENGNVKRSIQHIAEANGGFSIQLHIHHRDNTDTLWP